MWSKKFLKVFANTTAPSPTLTIFIGSGKIGTDPAILAISLLHSCIHGYRSVAYSYLRVHATTLLPRLKQAPQRGF